ncbi:MAG: hypothetical protein KAR73_14090, partial [Spirochaetales bacterium]|nr:hypothetical protein [Spirochaetales bacterium]
LYDCTVVGGGSQARVICASLVIFFSDLLSSCNAPKMPGSYIAQPEKTTPISPTTDSQVKTYFRNAFLVFF